MRLNEKNSHNWEKLKFKMKNELKNTINIDTSDSEISSLDSED